MTHDFGRFVWFRLNTPDVPRAAAFYGEVFGWKAEDIRMPDGTPYTLIKAGEAPIGGFGPLPKPGMAAHWIGYISVADVDAAAAKLVGQGARSLMDAFDVATVGRMQPLADPHGAAFFVYRSLNGDGPAAEGPGSVHWCELVTADPEAAVAFYEAALGYTHETMNMPHGTYFVLKNGDALRGGVFAGSGPARWVQYVTVEDCDAALARAERGGGRVVMPATDVPGVGRFAQVADPMGAEIGLITPAAP